MMLKLPVDFSAFFQNLPGAYPGTGKNVEPVFPRSESDKEAIDSFLELLLSSYPGECSFFFDFAFSFWGQQHENFSVEQFNNAEQPRSKMENRLRHVIDKYESRLTDVRVDLLLTQKSFKSKRKSSDNHIIVINVRGLINNRNQTKYHRTIYFDSKDIPGNNRHTDG